MGKRSRSQEKEKRGSKRRAVDEDVALEDIDDEIDAFHKQKYVEPRTFVVMLGSQMVTMNSLSLILRTKRMKRRMEMMTLNCLGLLRKLQDSKSFCGQKLVGRKTKCTRRRKKMKTRRPFGGSSKRQHYNADEAASSDEEIPAEEEAEVLRLQREKAKSLSMRTLGLKILVQMRPLWNQL
ncbi:uncharacterized protein LOC120287660 [Eucalyptus grandis]|uniref:uncharacterized protein LOC120287660 n=1 Tax=Eucalyptus grandis TaxID=71139 RepID=UPI00192EB134|nr:uncharacterized protein LOC120287660 [Eucalyptus grandis]